MFLRAGEAALPGMLAGYGVVRSRITAYVPLLLEKQACYAIVLMVVRSGQSRQLPACQKITHFSNGRYTIKLDNFNLNFMLLSSQL